MIDPEILIGNNIIVVYGNQKVGKTSLAATMPKGSKVHLIDLDRGTENLARLWIKTHKLADLSVTPVLDASQFHRAVWNLPKGHGLYVIDTYSKACDRFIEAEAEIEIDGSRRMNQHKWGIVSGKAHNYYARFVDQIAQMVQKEGRDNVWGLILAHSKRNEVPTGNYQTEIHMQPLITGSAEAAISGDASFLFFMEEAKVAKPDGTVGTARRLRTRATGRIKAGDRTDALRAEEPADLSVILSKIVAARTKLLKELEQQTKE